MRINRMAGRALWLLCALLVLSLAGCAVGPDYVAPMPPPAPEKFTHTDETTPAGQALAQNWWGVWNDPVLDRLVEEAVKANLDLKIAATRVLEARALAVQAGSDRYPSVEIGGRVGRTRSPATFGDTQRNVLSASAAASWEVDLWKRVANQTEAAERDVDAARQDQLRAYQSLVTQTVKAYVDARLFDEQARLTRETSRTDARRMEIIKGRYDAGLVPALDVYLMRQTLADGQARVHTFALQSQLARHRLNVLLGRYPAMALDAREGDEPLIIPAPVPPGLPSELMLRRPDLRGMVDRFAAAHARANVSRAALFPRISLTGSIGRESDDLEGLFIGDHTFWNLFGNLAYPLFNAGALNAEVDRSDAARQRTFLQYANGVLAAFREVEDALVTEREQRLRLVALEQSVEHAEQSLEASESRYRRGLDDLIPSLNARRLLFLADLERIESRRRILTNRAELHLALGGAWGHENELEARIGQPVAATSSETTK